MTFRIVILLALQTNLDLFAQNLIPNSSFELSPCPSSYSKKPSDFKVENWFAADDGTPDYYNSCAKEYVGIPYNWTGGQNPVDGEGYIGIYLKKGRLYQENISIQLTKPLLKGVTYSGSFSITNAAKGEFLGCAISIALSQDRFHINLKNTYDLRQVVLPIPAPDDFADFKWDKLSFTYQAQGGERFLYVGSLQNPVDHCRKNVSRVGNEMMLNDAAYVYLDDFYLGEKNAVPETVSPSFELVEDLRPISIYYEFNECSIKEIDSDKLDSLAHSLIGADYQLLITGSTDSVGTDSYNSELGLKRAMVVKQHLMFVGVSGDKIEVKTKGENTPNYPNHSDAYRSLNRSALIEFFIKAK